MFRLAIFSGLLLVTLLLTGCFGGRGISCEDQQRYRGSVSAAPLRIPDDLSPPDDSQALVIPPGPYTALDTAPAASDRCLETPPRFFGEGFGQ
jgi:hypothetical protein